MSAAAAAPRDPLTVLRELFAAHQAEAGVEDGWVRLPRGCRARAVFHARPGAPSIQLDVIFEPWTGWPLIESYAGVGETRAAQEADAWAAFAGGGLHALLAAFLYHDDATVERTAWEVDGTTRAVTLGAILTRGTPPEHGAWQAALRAFIEGSTLPEGTHWVRLFYAQHDGDRLACEVLLDNEPWDDARDAMEAFAWPARDGFYSVRGFLVLQGGVDVSRAVAAMVDRPDVDDAGHVRALVERGVEPTEAELLVALIPLAFGRVLVEHLGLGFAPVAELHPRSGGAPRTLRLEDDPLFTEATWLAERARDQGTLTRDQFVSLALRSAEVDALGQALDAGAQPADLELSPPIISVP